jgi:hypothetical protein
MITALWVIQWWPVILFMAVLERRALFLGDHQQGVDHTANRQGKAEGDGVFGDNFIFHDEILWCSVRLGEQAGFYPHGNDGPVAFNH